MACQIFRENANNSMITQYYTKKKERERKRERKYYLTANIIRKYEVKETESHRNKTKRNDE